MKKENLNFEDGFEFDEVSLPNNKRMDKNKKKNDKRGEVGGIVLKKRGVEVVKINTKKLLKVLRRYRDERIPLVKSVLSEEVGLSSSTLNRKPYKGIIEEYMMEEKTLLSPNGKQEVAELIKENIKLKNEINYLKEKYDRLKKEITYSKELF